MILHRLPSCIQWYYNANILMRFPTQEQKLYLTFDDGPHPKTTPLILSILHEKNAKATFFCKGENALQYPQLIQQIENEGHSLGNHTFSHLNGWKTETTTYITDVEQCHQVIHSLLFRPPYGRITKAQVQQLLPKYQIVLWSLMSEDYNPKLSAETCLRKAIHRTRKGDIIVFHDSEKAAKNTLYVLPQYLEFFSKKGYSFETINTCNS